MLCVKMLQFRAAAQELWTRHPWVKWWAMLMTHCNRITGQHLLQAKIPLALSLKSRSCLETKYSTLLLLLLQCTVYRQQRHPAWTDPTGSEIIIKVTRWLMMEVRYAAIKLHLFSLTWSGAALRWHVFEVSPCITPWHASPPDLTRAHVYVLNIKCV